MAIVSRLINQPQTISHISKPKRNEEIRIYQTINLRTNSIFSFNQRNVNSMEKATCKEHLWRCEGRGNRSGSDWPKRGIIRPSSSKLETAAVWRGAKQFAETARLFDDPEPRIVNIRKIMSGGSSSDLAVFLSLSPKTRSHFSSCEEKVGRQRRLVNSRRRPTGWHLITAYYVLNAFQQSWNYILEMRCDSLGRGVVVLRRFDQTEKREE